MRPVFVMAFSIVWPMLFCWEFCGIPEDGIPRLPGVISWEVPVRVDVPPRPEHRTVQIPERLVSQKSVGLNLPEMPEVVRDLDVQTWLVLRMHVNESDEDSRHKGANVIESGFLVPVVGGGVTNRWIFDMGVYFSSRSELSVLLGLGHASGRDILVESELIEQLLQEPLHDLLEPYNEALPIAIGSPAKREVSASKGLVLYKLNGASGVFLVGGTNRLLRDRDVLRSGIYIRSREELESVIGRIRFEEGSQFITFLVWSSSSGRRVSGTFEPFLSHDDMIRSIAE